MPSQVRPRTAAIVLVSLAAHLAVLAWLGLVRGGLVTPYAPPPPVVVDIRPVIIPQRRAEPDAPASARPLVVRQSRLDPRTSEVPPLVAPVAPPQAPAPPAAAPPDLGAILRQRLDCSDLSRLTPEQRVRCAERFAEGRDDGKRPLPLGIDPRKQAEFDRVAREKAALMRKREGDPFRREAAWDREDAIGNPYISGSGSDGLGGSPAPEASPHSTAARKTPRLPP